MDDIIGKKDLILKPILDHFGILAPFYEKFIKPYYPERLLALADLNPDSIILDVGAGTGRLAQFFHTKAAQIVVMDESLDMLHQSQAKEGLQPNLSHAENLPFQTHTFDRILMVDVLHHVADQQKTAEELWRVIKPGGRIIIEEPNIHKLGSKLIALAEKMAFMRSHFLSPERIIQLFSKSSAGIELEYEGSLVRIVISKK